MTEASKARKRQPMRVIHGPPMIADERSKILRALAEMGSTMSIVLPPAARFEAIYPKRRGTPVVLLSGISCRAGVGGRRGRKRERARDRRAMVRDTTLGTPRWIRAKPDPLSAEDRRRLAAALRRLLDERAEEVAALS